MKSERIIYNIVNIIFLVISILLVNYTGIIDMNFSISELIVLAILFVIIHLFKFIRIYFLLLEEGISLKRRIKIYIKTTFVSIVLPYKLGELFKMYSYGYETKNYAKGIISVLMDKFFDAVILCLVLVPYGMIQNGHISSLTYILLAFIIVILVVYLSFESTYYYLNKFFIIKNKSKKGLFALNMLEKLNGIYISAKEMIHGRYVVLLCLTAIIWTTEALFIYIMSGFMNIKTEFVTIINYISDAFFGINNILFNNYIYLCTAIFLVIMGYIYFKKCIDGGKKVWKK